jgi:LmbE family N-acetylglucosaminyl deacetylase
MKTTEKNIRECNVIRYMRKIWILLVALIVVLMYRTTPSPAIVYFAPHPDDEVAGAYALHSMNGDKKLVVVTDSTWQGQGEPPLESIYIRRNESIAGAGYIGIPPEDVVFCGIEEADLDTMSVSEVAEVLEDYVSDADIVFIPSAIDATYHPHHAKVRDAVLSLVTDQKVMVWTLNSIHLDPYEDRLCTWHIRKWKEKMLLLYASQMDAWSICPEWEYVTCEAVHKEVI